MHLVCAVTRYSMPNSPSVQADHSLRPEWRETAFQRGTYGGNDHDGVAASFEGEAMSLRVVPVRYEAREGEERVTSLVDDFEGQWRDPTTFVPDVSRQVAFAVVADYEPVGGEKRAVYTVTADADDALAATLWLANGSPDAGALHRNIRLHRGDPVSRTQAPVADDDALTALFADEPSRCMFTGNPTRSHHITLPYRYAPFLDGFRRTDRGLPRVPTTIDSLTGGVSHSEWTDRDLASVTWSSPIERIDAGEYQVGMSVVDALEGAMAEAVCLNRLGGT